MGKEGNQTSFRYFSLKLRLKVRFAGGRCTAAESKGRRSLNFQGTFEDLSLWLDEKKCVNKFGANKSKLSCNVL